MSLRQLNLAVPIDLETICLKCLEKEANKRHGSADALSQDLGRFLRNEPILARPIGRLERVRRWCWRNPVVAGMASAIVVSLATIATVMTVAYYREARLSHEKSILVELEKASRAQANRERDIAEQLARSEAQAKEQAQTALDLSEHRLYASQIATVQTSWEANNAAGAWLTLRSTREDFRGWEFKYLCVLLSKNQTTLFGHGNAVMSVAFSSDGHTFASGSDDATIKLWNVGDETPSKTLSGHDEGVLAVNFTLDGTILASGGRDNLIKIWNSSTGELLQTLRGHVGPVSSLVFHPEGKQIVSGSWDGTAKIWSIEPAELMHSLDGHTEAVLGVAFDPSGQTIATASYDTAIHLWDTGNRKKSKSLVHPPMVEVIPSELSLRFEGALAMSRRVPHVFAHRVTGGDDWD